MIGHLDKFPYADAKAFFDQTEGCGINEVGHIYVGWFSAQYRLPH